MARQLDTSSRVQALDDRTAGYGLDYRFRVGRRLWIDLELKAKWQATSPSTASLWPGPADDLFLLDERALRGLVAAGVHSCLVVYDATRQRWCYAGIWDLLLADRVRFDRAGRRDGDTFLKGKVLLRLDQFRQRDDFHVDTVIAVSDHNARWTHETESYDRATVFERMDEAAF